MRIASFAAVAVALVIAVFLKGYVSSHLPN